MNRLQNRLFMVAIVLVSGISSSSMLARGSETTSREYLSSLDDLVQEFHLIEGSDGIGGPSMLDAVEKIRALALVPINFEEKEYDMNKNGLTLAKAIDRLRALRDQGSLGNLDHIRLERYEALSADVENIHTFIISPNKHTFRVNVERVVLRELLNQIIMLDSNYEWWDAGEPQNPVIVIHPRQEEQGALDWPIKSLCAEQRIDLSELYVPNGPFIDLLSNHNITIFGAEIYLAKIDSYRPCKEIVTALQLLNTTTKRSRPPYEWTLVGVAGNRFLTFGRAR